MVKVATNVSDPVADLLARIRNAAASSREQLYVPASKMNDAILSILKREGYIGPFAREGEGVEQAILVSLKYGRARERSITGMRRISKPGRRVYVGRHELPRVLGGLGIAILSTSHGVMTDREASKKGIGGEVLAHVW